MKLILLPQLDHEDDLPVGMTHPVGTHCPFSNGGTRPVGSTCCSVDATEAVRALKRIGECGLADLLQSDLDLEHVHGAGYFLRDFSVNLAALHLQHRLAMERLPPLEREAASNDARKRGVEFLNL